ncbi:MAG TPA: AMP-binding protein [Thermoanaerobaculia bacterium]
MRATFFQDLDAVFYAAAALPQHLWEKLERLAIEATGRRVVMLSAWGSTETAPSATQIHFHIERAGVIGLPGAGTEIKLAPAGNKFELRVKGPNVTPGYWRRLDLTREQFDEARSPTRATSTSAPCSNAAPVSWSSCIQRTPSAPIWSCRSPELLVIEGIVKSSYHGARGSIHPPPPAPG